MKKTLLLLEFLLVTIFSNAQNVGECTTTPLSKLHVSFGASGNVNPFSPLVVEGNNNTYINLLTPNINEGGLLFGKADNAASGGIIYNNTGTPNGFQFRTNENTTRMVITNSGYVGIGNSNPAYQLDVSNRIRIRSGGNLTNTAGLWLNNYANTEAVFIGMENDSHVGFFGVGIGWRFGMNIQTGALKINGCEGTAGQVIVSSGAASASWGYANSHYIGESYGGGIVFYVYDNGQHGLIAFTSDQAVALGWSYGVNRYTGTTGDGLGGGYYEHCFLNSYAISR